MQVSPIYIVDELCDGCGACKNICVYDAVSLENRKAIIDIDKCTLCMMCVKVCKVKAINITEIKKDSDVFGYRGVWVFIEYQEDKITPGCLQILSKGYKLAAKLNQELTAVIVGSSNEKVEEIKDVVDEYGADSVIFLYSQAIHSYQVEDVANIVSTEILLRKPAIVLFLGSFLGRVLAPRIAAKVKTGLTADCTDLYIDYEGKLVQVRPTYGGKILASIVCPYDRPQMASVRSNIFESKKIKKNHKCASILLKEVWVNSIDKVKSIVNTFDDETSNLGIDEARIIVCGGYGVGSKEGFNLLKQLADKLGGVVAGTRSVVDEGWLDFSHQIGQTGKTVRPMIYIGCGVSGAIHHLIGMKNSKFIIAINRDSNAPIFKYADIGVVADLFELVPRLIESF